MFDLHEALDMCVNLLSSSLRDRIEVVRDYGEIGRVFGPAGQLNQVFMNILNNAQQAIIDDGAITITTRQEDEWVSVRISDTGCGIPADVREEDLRSVLHDQGARSRYRLGPLAELWIDHQARAGRLNVRASFSGVQSSSFAFRVWPKRRPRMTTFRNKWRFSRAIP